MKYKKLKNSDDAVVGIIVAVLLIGLVLIIVSVFQTVFIPNWMKNIEAGHMDEVAGQFSQLKFAVDIQSSLQTNDIPVSVPITIGNKQFPLLQSSQSFGQIDILDNSSYFSFGNISESAIVYIGNVVFDSFNAYFIDQTYIYEAGAIIVSQNEGNIMTVRPDFSLEITGGGTSFDANFSLINITDVGNKDTASGYGTYPIRVEYDNGYLEEIPDDITTITISSNYAESWQLYFINLFRNAISNSGLTYSDYETIISHTPGSNIVTVDIGQFALDLGLTAINLDVYRIDIKSQIAPGWVEG